MTVGKDPVDLRFKLRRWIDMAARGWYSGETHVHRSAEELPNLMLAEDLNVAFPLSYWVTEAFASPKTARKGPFRGVDPKPIAVDPTHVIYPLNTEYEIFTVGKKRHTLGAFFALNHQTVLDAGVPPVKPIAERVHKEGGLIELDKHNWPWSMAIVPVAKVDLFELANNHVWRTEFGFGEFGEPAPEYMKVERDKNGFTERGWLDYGFQNYYALLNCGFRLRPTAGTASGVHPVPLGFGRVYVHCPDGFSYDAWVRGLDRGESFVTTGPMLLVQVNGKGPGTTFKPGAGEAGVSDHGGSPERAAAGPRGSRRQRRGGPDDQAGEQGAGAGRLFERDRREADHRRLVVARGALLRIAPEEPRPVRPHGPVPHRRPGQAAPPAGRGDRLPDPPRGGADRAQQGRPAPRRWTSTGKRCKSIEPSRRPRGADGNRNPSDATVSFRLRTILLFRTVLLRAESVDQFAKLADEIVARDFPAGLQADRGQHRPEPLRDLVLRDDVVPVRVDPVEDHLGLAWRVLRQLRRRLRALPHVSGEADHHLVPRLQAEPDTLTRVRV